MHVTRVTVEGTDAKVEFSAPVPSGRLVTSVSMHNADDHADWEEGALLFMNVDSESIPSSRYRIGRVDGPAKLKLSNPFDLDSEDTYEPYAGDNTGGVCET